MVAILSFMRSSIVLMLLAVAACSSTTEQVGQAASTPLRDLNVVKTEIPPLLLQAQAAPYALPASRDCPALQAEWLRYTEVLGPDLDATPEQRKGWAERGQAEVGKALTRAAEGAVPFRGWLRKLSGAERQERRVAAAVEAGEARRAYLRGWLAAQSCS